MAIITLITDWQNRDYYSGMIKGRLLRLMPDANIVEINQHIEPFHILQASFILRQVLCEYPDGTIHLFLVNQGHQPGIWPVVAKYRNQYIVGWDDGILPLSMDTDPGYYLRVDHAALDIMDRETGIAELFRSIEPTFPELSMFTRIAKFLSSNPELEIAGPNSPDSSRFNTWQPVIRKDQIDGQVVFIDSYRNAITNIPRTEFIRIGAGRTFEITIKSNRYKIYGISNTYLESDPGELLAIFNSAGLLEIAIAQGNAAELLGFEPGTPIKIRFDEQ
ncbi:MAG: SAM-dependent chlorinase/fluorinase [Bacteroidales bacterium]|nr:SAM-dependent chlorinase/fluorinase [Bacteroidales bacterium]